jgi:hypothetical protein
VRQGGARLPFDARGNEMGARGGGVQAFINPIVLLKPFATFWSAWNNGECTATVLRGNIRYPKTARSYKQHVLLKQQISLKHQVKNDRSL